MMYYYSAIVFGNPRHWRIIYLSQIDFPSIPKLYIYRICGARFSSVPKIAKMRDSRECGTEELYLFMGITLQYSTKSGKLEYSLLIF